jgi:hypothetical protein
MEIPVEIRLFRPAARLGPLAEDVWAVSRSPDVIRQ